MDTTDSMGYYNALDGLSQLYIEKGTFINIIITVILILFIFKQRNVVTFEKWRALPSNICISIIFNNKGREEEKREGKRSGERKNK